MSGFAERPNVLDKFAPDHAVQAWLGGAALDRAVVVYAHQDSLKILHDNVAAFIGRTDNQTGG